MGTERMPINANVRGSIPGGTVTADSIRNALGYTPADDAKLTELQIAFDEFGEYAGIRSMVFESQIDGNTITIANTMDFLTGYVKRGEVLIYGFAENKILAAKVYPSTNMLPTLAAVGTMYTQNGDSMDDYTAESCVIYLEKAEKGDHVIGSIVVANTAISDADSIEKALGYTPADAEETAKTPVTINGTYNLNSIRIDNMTHSQLEEMIADRDVVIIAFNEDETAMVIAKGVQDVGAVGTLYLMQDGENVQSVGCIINLRDNGQGDVVGYLTVTHTYIPDEIKTEIAQQAAALVDTALLSIIGSGEVTA